MPFALPMDALWQDVTNIMSSVSPLLSIVIGISLLGLAMRAVLGIVRKASGEGEWW